MSNVTKVSMGSLYIDGTATTISDTPVAFTSGSSLEIKTASSDSTKVIEWVQIAESAKTFYLATRNILSGISYANLLQQGLVNGSKIITLNDTKYKLRLISSSEWDEFVLNGLGTLLTPTTQDISGVYTDTDISNSESNSLWHWYNKTSLTTTLSDSAVVTRGGTNIGTSTNIALTDTTSYYRPLLEKYNTPPVISGTDTALGTYTLSFTKDFTVTDSDSDLLQIVMMVDSTTIGTLTGQSAGTTFTLDMSTVWSGLSAGSHTIYIIVTDTYGNIVQRTWTFSKKATSTTSSAVSTLTTPTITIDANSTMLDPIDATVDNIIYFEASGGDVIYGHRIYILDNSTDAVVYDSKETNYYMYTTIPSGTLTNGGTYQVKLRTYNEDGDYSEWSSIVLLYCLSPAVLNITNIIDGYITTQNPNMTATYTQSDIYGGITVSDALYSYKYLLYKNGELVQYSSELTDGLLTYQFSDLENKTTYEVELITKSKKGMTTTVTTDFYCLYSQSRLPSLMTLTPDYTNGSIQISVDARQILGRLYSGNTVTYKNDTWADLHSSTIIYDADSPISLYGDFTCEIWAKEIEDDENVILTLTSSNAIVTLTRQGNMFYLKKYVSGYLMYQRHVFIAGDIETDDEFYFFVQHNITYGLMDFDVKRVTNGRSTWWSSSSTNDVAPSYSTEDGFLANLDSNFVNILQDTTINNENLKVYIPTSSDLASVISGISAKVNQAIIGQAILGDTSTNVTMASADSSYFTRDISSTDSNKLIVYESTGQKTTAYPNDSTIGLRIMVNIPSTTKISTTKDTSDSCYYMALAIFDLFDTQTISELKVGDKVKSYNIRYKEEIIRFTVSNVDTTSSIVTLISDSLNTTREFDASESVYTNGNPNWNTSNLKQWLNSSTKIG